jgi:hypothetical protein
MSQNTNAVAVRTIGIDTGKNTFHLIAPTAGMAVRGFPTTFGSLRVLFCCQTDQHHSK